MIKIILILIFSFSILEASQSLKNLDKHEIFDVIEKGSAYLLKDQNKDGSWGSPNQTKGLNIFAPAPGSHRAFRLAVTSLALHGLIENKELDPNYDSSISLAKDYLLNNLTSLRRASPMAIYNIWSHAFGIHALVKLYQSKHGSGLEEKIKSTIRQQIFMLQKYESVDGGWGYYDFNVQTKQPSGSSISFVNATVLIAIREAHNIGIEAPKDIVDRAIKAIQRQRLADNSYLYGEYLKYRPRRGINRPAGSLGRSNACNLALQLWGDSSITVDVHKACLDRLIKRNGWLDVARKRPVPHESWFAVAGYFFYYGHLYASLCIKKLPENEQPEFKEKLSEILIPLQEKDGSWWDFPFYNYHKQYGTAMALISLANCKS